MSMARLEAMVKRSRMPGECSLKACAEIDKLIGDLHDEMEPYKRQIRELEQLRKKATTPKCSLLKPLVSPKTGLEPVAVYDCDDVAFYWCDEYDDEMIPFDEWPVDREYVWTSDLEELGFRVEVA
jgi:hypothetical protein